MENESEGQAILGQTDGVMIADADWLASHSHPRISMWTVTSETSKACQLLSVFSFAMSKNTRTKEFAAENLRFTIRWLKVAVVSSVSRLAKGSVTERLAFRVWMQGSQGFANTACM